MRDALPKTIYLKDYSVPDFLIDKTALHFALDEKTTRVTATLSLRRNPESTSQNAALVLDGQNFNLLSVAIDGQVLDQSCYQQSAECLTINTVPDQFELLSITELKPQDNTTLEGLYKSKTMFCTQCEAEGFRNITYYLDRPDVMSVFTTTIEADKSLYPVLLSNGNFIEAGDADNGRHWIRWDDPFKKPAYLFALVAGDLQFTEDNFTTMNGKQVCLRIYVEAKDLDKCEHAMSSLINAMRWDEQVYGREYDLSIFNIVAVDDFNMGAMENKSLNIFNTSCVLAKAATTTDAGFQRVEGVVAHEYFHNWSGNRVTCRDWFQLSLKEGFTVYRDAEFSSDMGSRTVKRVEDVSLLRTVQFAEDGGPMAHPVRPESFIEISNFYTVTIYEKGSEVVRMIANLLGPELFRKGSDLYFDRHDGQAVTCEDFVKAMEDASGTDLQQFRRWYSQAGTPRLTVSWQYDAQLQSLTLTVSQHCPATPGQAEKQPFHIPLAVALIGQQGELPLQLAGAASSAPVSTELVLDVTEAEQQFVFEQVEEDAVPSLLRGFSAPVKLSCNYSRDQLMLLMSKDSDGFVRWDAAQQLGVQVLHDMITALQAGEEMVLDARLLEAYRTVLLDSSLDKAMVALMLQLPTEAYLAEIAEVVDVQAIHTARSTARKLIAEQLQEQLWQVYHDNQLQEVYQANADQIAARSLKNTVLAYLMLLDNELALQACSEQFDRSENMTDVLAAFNCLLNSPYEAEKARVLEVFYQRWHDESLVVNQWFMAQAVCTVPGALERVKQLMTHPAFDIKNPNKVRSLIGAFCGQNAVNFHQPVGAGYRFLTEQILFLNTVNPQVASRMVGPLTKWRKYPQHQQQLMKAELEQIMAEPELSRDVFEVVSKSLGA
jgi:aminopeptidase N